MYDDHQSSSYDVEYCSWSNTPDTDFALADDNPWYAGQFVWTGFDYLGEPTPYNNDSWPSHSSVFGIFDLANIPKDRYYLYRSKWNRQAHTLHVLPHWTWPGREGLITPVMVYTDYPEAELFVNGRSMGRQRKLSATEVATSLHDSLALLRRYRLIWDNVKYDTIDDLDVLREALVEYVDTLAPGGHFGYAAVTGGLPGDPMTKKRMDVVMDVYMNYAFDWYKNH